MACNSASRFDLAAYSFLTFWSRLLDITLLFQKISKVTTAHDYLLYAHSKKTKTTQNKPKAKETKHSTL